MFKLNLLDPGTPITEQTLQNNANVILEYLCDRGYFNAEVTYTQTPLQDQNDVGVTFHVKPNAEAKVETFRVDISGANNAAIMTDLKLNWASYCANGLMPIFKRCVRTFGTQIFWRRVG